MPDDHASKDIEDAGTVARDLLDHWNRRDLDGFMNLLDADIVWYDPAMPDPPARGKSEVRAFSESVLAAFPDFRYEIREPVWVSPDGRRCTIPWRIEATHSGWLIPPGFGPTGQKASFAGIDLFDCMGGKVVRIETFFDAIAAAEQLLQLRIRPRPGSLRERLAVYLQRGRARWLRLRFDRKP